MDYDAKIEDDSMLFKIERGWNDFKPLDHPKLKQIEIYKVNQRTVDNPLKLPHHVPVRKTWYDEGENHRISGGMITRDERELAWVMDCKIQDVMDICCGELTIENWDEEYKQLNGEDLPVIRLKE